MREHLRAVAESTGTVLDRRTEGETGYLVVLPIWYSRDLDAAERFVEALGLRPRIASKDGGWRDYRADGGGLVALHADHEDPHVWLAFEYQGDLAVLADQLGRAGFDAEVIDEAYNRTLRVMTPDGWALSINGAQSDLYGYHRVR